MVGSWGVVSEILLELLGGGGGILVDGSGIFYGNFLVLCPIGGWFGGGGGLWELPWDALGGV